MRYLIRWETPDHFNFTPVSRNGLAGKITEILSDSEAVLWGIESSEDDLEATE